MDFINVNLAHDLLQKASLELKITKITLNDGLGFFTASDIYANMDVPSFDNSAMDGFSFKYSDYIKNKKLIIGETIKAGDVEKYIFKEGEAFKIFTGAPIPKGIDTVIPQEDVLINNGFLEFSNLNFKKGSHIRPKGSQTKKGSLILSKNTFVTAGIIGFLASFGIEFIEVYEKPRIGIILTGKELIESGKKLEFGQIYETNGASLKALLRELRFVPELILKIDDDFSSTKEAISEALKKVDILILTGGISKGDFDFVQEGLIANGVQKLFYKIKQKPGKPIFFGTLSDKVIFALPGNPAAVFTCFHAYVKPYLLSNFSGYTKFLEVKKGVLSNTYQKKAGLTHWVKGILKEGKIDILTGQESYKMDAFAQANVLAILEEEKESFEKGDVLDYINI